MPISKEYCWLAHSDDQKAGKYVADDGWMAIFERNCVIWADKYLYASTKDANLFQHGIDYRHIKPFGIKVLGAKPEFIAPNVKVKRVKL